MGGFFKALAWFIAIVGGGLLLLRTFVFDVWTIPGDDSLLSASVQPALFPGDVLVLTRRGSASRGYLMRCPDPEAPGRFVVARAMGRAGDHLEIANEQVTIDGHRNPSPRACDEAKVTVADPGHDGDVTLACSVEEYGDFDFDALRDPEHPEPPVKAVVEDDRWFLVSDDRHFHLDSRDFGQVDTAACQHVVFRLVGATGPTDTKKRLTFLW